MTHNLDELLLNMLGSHELVQQWWNSPNTAFGGDTPQQWFQDQALQAQVVSYIYKHSGYWI